MILVFEVFLGTRLFSIKLLTLSQKYSRITDNAMYDTVEIIEKKNRFRAIFIKIRIEEACRRFSYFDYT